MKQSERMAETVLRRIFPNAEVQQRDTGTGSSVRDFDVIRGSEVVAAVEVTETTRRPAKAFEAELKRNADQIPAKQVEDTWLVFLDPGNARLERRAAEIDSCLAKFEKLGLQHFIASDGVPDDATVGEKEARDQAWRLRILWANRYSSARARILVTSGAGEAFCSSHDYVNSRVKELADRKDNIGKLGASGCARRILFVIADALTDYPCWKQVVDYSPAEPPPELPPEVTEVWVTARDRDGEFVVWRASGEGWEHLGVFSSKSPTG